ncbi:hypothetical protein M432DRAFT_589346 [Thermoascus aurantiacus ATCC 26904]
MMSLVIPSALDKRESMAAPDFHNPHMDFPSLSEFYYLDSEPVCKDTTTSFCPWDFVNENLAFDIPPPNHINAESQIPALDAYPSLAEQNSRVLSNRASCTSLLPSDLESEEGTASLFSGSLSPVLSSTEQEGCFRTQTQGSDPPAYLSSPARIASLGTTPEHVSRNSPSTGTSTQAIVSSPSSISEAEPLPPPVLETSSSSSPRQKVTTTNARKPSRISSDDPNNKDVAASNRRKAAHNAVEKRYRSNLNAKFQALSNAIPSLRDRTNSSRTNSANANKGIRTNLKDGGVQFQNKSEVLTRALAYIQQLQEEKFLLQNEINVLKDNLLPGGLWRSARRGGAERA